MADELTKDVAPKTAVITMVMDTNKTGDQYVEDKVRSKLSKEVVEELRTLGYTPYVVFNENTTPATKKVIQDNAIGIREAEFGMGKAFMQAMRELDKTSKGFEYAVWMEVEKQPFVPLIAKTLAPLRYGGADHVVPARNEMFEVPPLRSYPNFQAYTEMAGNSHFNRIAYGRKLDLADAEVRRSFLDVYFGPDAWNQSSVRQYFFDYEKNDFPEKKFLWDIHMMPIIKMLNDGKYVRSVPIPYRHPASQTAAEESDMEYLKWVDKRIAQLTTISKMATSYRKFLDQTKT